MKYENAGTYELKYTATDECGNTVERTRTVIVKEAYNDATVFFEDGTLIINSLATDRETQIAEHGAVVEEYATAPYSFVSQSDIPWLARQREIKAVKFGSNVKQTSCKRLFNQLYEVIDIDLTGLDTSDCTDMSMMFSGCTKMSTVNFELLDTSNVTDMQLMFLDCKGMTSLDLSSFDTAKVTNMQQMFRNDVNVATIYASDKFVTDQVTNSNAMFLGCTALVGAIPYDANVTDKTNANLQGYFTAK